MPDAVFADPRLAALYDPLDPDRSDLDEYLALAEDLGARSVLDIGCGTGTFALLLAARGMVVVGVDPALASLEVARAKAGADQVSWVHGTAAGVPPLAVDLVTMTANVAQAIVADYEWSATLHAAFDRLRPGGHLVFETRIPARRAWEQWAGPITTTEVDGVGPVREWYEIVTVESPLVTFRSATRLPDGEVLWSESTLRFREREEVERDLASAGFDLIDVRDAPDRPGREWVFVATKPRGGSA